MYQKATRINPDKGRGSWKVRAWDLLQLVRQVPPWVWRVIVDLVRSAFDV
jgi:hypothetical protein